MHIGVILERIGSLYSRKEYLEAITKKMLQVCHFILSFSNLFSTGLSKKMDGIWNRYNLKSTGRIYTFGILKCSEKFKVLDLP